MNTESQAAPSPGARLLMGGVRLYQKALSPVLGGNCRYYPSCSEYGYDAIRLHGAARGSWMAVKRIGRCHPFHEGGFDPVPEPDQNEHKHNTNAGSDA
ncbi:MAG: membrane protein insertion efficiency factor YidD [Actinomycetota bacterium]